MLKVGDIGHYVDREGRILTWFGLIQVIQIRDGWAMTRGNYESIRWFPADGSPRKRYQTLPSFIDNLVCDPDAYFMKEEPDMLNSKMTFPATFDTVFGSNVIVVIEGRSEGGAYYGYSTNTLGDYANKSAGLWDLNGNCLFTNNNSATKQSRNLVKPKSQTQKLYEQLDADGKALVRLVGEKSLQMLQTYLREKLKVDVNLGDASSVWHYGQKVEWK